MDKHTSPSLRLEDIWGQYAQDNGWEANLPPAASPVVPNVREFTTSSRVPGMILPDKPLSGTRKKALAGALTLGLVVVAGFSYLAFNFDGLTRQLDFGLLSMAPEEQSQNVASASEGSPFKLLDESEEAFGMLELDEKAAKLAKEKAEEAKPRPDNYDPFAPMLDSYLQQAGLGSTIERDILENVQFTGFIDDRNAKGKVAIIQVSGPNGAYSEVKKVGDSFYLEGKTIKILDVKNNQLFLNAAGAKRSLYINAINDSVGNSGGGATSSAPAGTGEGGSQIVNLPPSGGSSGGSGGAPSAPASGGASPNLSGLRE